MSHKRSFGNPATESMRQALCHSAEQDACTTSASAEHTNTKAVILLIDDLDIRVIETDTAEVLRAFTLNPNIGNQPRFKTNETPEPGVRGFQMS